MNKNLLKLWAQINEADTNEDNRGEVFHLDWINNYEPSDSTLTKYQEIKKVIDDLKLTYSNKRIDCVYEIIQDLFKLYTLTECDPFYYELNKIGAWFYCNELDVEEQLAIWLRNFLNFLEFNK